MLVVVGEIKAQFPTKGAFSAFLKPFIYKY